MGDAIPIKVIKVYVQEDGIIRSHEGRSKDLLIGRLVDGIDYKNLERMEETDERESFRELKLNLKIYEDEIKRLKRKGINKDILKEIIEYIESKEVEIDLIRGKVRRLDEIAKEGDMPEIYNTLIKIYKEHC